MEAGHWASRRVDWCCVDEGHWVGGWWFETAASETASSSQRRHSPASPPASGAVTRLRDDEAEDVSWDCPLLLLFLARPLETQYWPSV